MAKEVMTLRIDDTMAAKLAASQAADNVSRTEIITRALDHYFSGKPEQVRGGTFDPRLDGERLNKQQYRVAAAMLTGEWLTLKEISAITGDPEASVSARLRDLRKIGHVVDRSRRGDPKRGIWEYRLVLVSKQAAA